MEFDIKEDEPTQPVAELPEMAVHASPLRALRTQAGITQSALAELAAVDIAVICALEAGESGIDRDLRERVAAAMNMPPELLVRGASERN